MKKLKYRYVAVIQGNYGQGWEDVSEYETNSLGVCKERVKVRVKRVIYGIEELVERERSLMSVDLKEYELMGYSHRVVYRKELMCKDSPADQK